MELTQSYLKSILNYDPDTGAFNWLSTGKGKRLNLLCGKSDRFGYQIIGIQRKYYKAHRLAFLYMTGDFPLYQVDHIDGDRANNSWGNLRDVTQSENQRNTIVRRKSSSGIPNVTWNKNAGKWRVAICGKHYGSFDDRFEAISVADSLRKENAYHQNHGRKA